MKDLLSFGVSAYLCFKGFSHYSNGNQGIGMLMIVCGVAGGIFKIYSMSQSDESVEETEEEIKEQDAK